MARRSTRHRAAAAEAGINRTAELVKSIGTILGVCGFLLALFPGLRLTVASWFSPSYEVSIGQLEGPRLSRLTGDQFYSSVWNHGLRQARNIFNIDGSILPNVSGQSVPAYRPGTRTARAVIAPGQCIYIKSLRFSFFRGDPATSLGSITEQQLRRMNRDKPEEALIQHMPAGFNAPGCDPESSDPRRACGAAGVWAMVSLVGCGAPG